MGAHERIRGGLLGAGVTHIGDATVIGRARRHLAARLDDEAVVLGLDRGLYFGLNEVATRVWELLEPPRRVEKVVATIRDEYEVDEETCRRDVTDLLERLVAEGLAEVAPAG